MQNSIIITWSGSKKLYKNKRLWIIILKAILHSMKKISNSFLNCKHRLPSWLRRILIELHLWAIFTQSRMTSHRFKNINGKLTIQWSSSAWQNTQVWAITRSAANWQPSLSSRLPKNTSWSTWKCNNSNSGCLNGSMKLWRGWLRLMLPLMRCASRSARFLSISFMILRTDQIIIFY